MILIDGNGKIVGQSTQNSVELFHTMLLLGVALEPGCYTLVVDTEWKSESPEFKEIIVKVQTQQKVKMSRMSHDDGLSRLEKAMIHWCQQSKFVEFRKYYR